MCKCANLQIQIYHSPYFFNSLKLGYVRVVTYKQYRIDKGKGKYAQKSSQLYLTFADEMIR